MTLCYGTPLTFELIHFETLELWDVTVVLFFGAIDINGKLTPDRKLIEIYYPRDNGADLLLNPCIPDDDWREAISELEEILARPCFAEMFD